MTSISLLRHHGLKDTFPRRLVLGILSETSRPLTVQKIVQLVRREEPAMSHVTVYRIIDALAGAGIIHRHAIDGGFSLCALPDVDGHHVLLRCTNCGRSEEVHDHALCRREEALARRKGFKPSHHLSELLGTCSHCR